MSPRRVPPAIGATLLFLLVFVVLFAPVLSGQATLVHGDALSVSLPLQQVLGASLEAGSLPLWSDRIYGGHPVFAEGQGGFAHPLNWLLFGALAPLFDGTDALVRASTLYAHGLLHVICGLIAALGTFALCRALSLGASASAFAALALSCSQDWLGQSSNSAIALSSAFAPTALWAVERWWRKPDVGRALIVALATSAMILGGYPQAVHALVVFAAVMLLARADASWWRSPWRHLATGGLAIVATLGLSAVQLLPTLELVGESVRAGGTALLPTADGVSKLRGLLFSVGERGVVEPGIGSLLVLAVAAMGLGRSRTVVAYALSSFVLLQLSMGEQSFLYRAAAGVLPGLESFRITHLYSTIGLIGVAVLAGFGAQRLTTWSEGTRTRWALILQGPIVLAVALGAAWSVDAPEVAALGYAPLLGAVVVVSLLFATRVAHLTPALLVLVLLVEIAALRLPLHDFVDVSTVSAPPPTVAELLARDAPEQNARITNVPRFSTHIVGYATATEPGLPRLARIVLASMDGGSNLIWDIPSVHANLALPLARRAAVSELLVEEVRGNSTRTPGERLMDTIGLRYIVARSKHRDREPYAKDLREIFRDDDHHFFILENENARPRLALVPRSEARWVPGVAEAIAALRSGDPAGLVLEGAPPAERLPGAEGEGSLPAEGSLRVEESRADRYEVVVEAAGPVYLVVGDAPYPGWKALVDGEPRPVLAANVLARAVEIPPGRHRVQVFFQSQSVQRGTRISLATSLVVLLLFVFRWLVRR